jgi:hypothetical protein
MRKISDFDIIQIINSNSVLFSKGGHLYFQDFKSNNIDEIENVDKTFDYFSFKDQILSIFTNRQIKNYKLILP